MPEHRERRDLRAGPGVGTKLNPSAAEAACYSRQRQFSKPLPEKPLTNDPSKVPRAARPRLGGCRMVRPRAELPACPLRRSLPALAAQFFHAFADRSEIVGDAGSGHSFSPFGTSGTKSSSIVAGRPGNRLIFGYGRQKFGLAFKR